MPNDALTISQIASLPDDSNWVAMLRERIAKLRLASGTQVLPPVARTVFLVDRVVTNTLSGGLGNLLEARAETGEPDQSDGGVSVHVSEPLRAVSVVSATTVRHEEAERVAAV